MKVVIAVPTLDMVSADFAFSLAALLGRRAYDRKLSREVPVALIHQTGSIIMEARNALVAQAQALAATHILFLDSDMVFPPDTLDRLVDRHVPIVCATYVKRVSPHELLGTPDTSPAAPNRLGLRPMLTIPLGCALISMKVFEALPKPYLAYLTTADKTMSEDTFFSVNARGAGFTIWMDPKLTADVGHVGTKVYRP